MASCWSPCRGPRPDSETSRGCSVAPPQALPAKQTGRVRAYVLDLINGEMQLETVKDAGVVRVSYKKPWDWNAMPEREKQTELASFAIDIATGTVDQATEVRNCLVSTLRLKVEENGDEDKKAEKVAGARRKAQSRASGGKVVVPPPSKVQKRG